MPSNLTAKTKTMKKLLIAVAALCVAAAIPAAQATSPKREMRGVWVSTHLSLDWPNRLQTPAQQRAALIGILDHNKATGMNAAFLQVRSQSDAMYPSTLEPWSYYLTNQQGAAPVPAWDPLQFAIDESRKRGLEFHAWINPYRAVATLSSAGNNAQYAASHVSRTHPEWLLTVGTVQILNPGLPQVRDHVTSVIMDIVERYDVDGIHFDDYFYPNGTPATIDDAAFNADPRGFPNTAAGRADWRRDNINMLIARVGENIRAAKPWVKFGVSPSGIYRSSTDPAIGSPTSAGALQHYSAMFADSRKWLHRDGSITWRAGLLVYRPGRIRLQIAGPMVEREAFGRHVYVGLADYKMNTAGWTSPSQIADQIALNRASTNIFGQIHFRHAFLAANPLNYRTDLKNNIYNRPALLPAMPWKDDVRPNSPMAVTPTLNADGSVTMSWAPQADCLDRVRQGAALCGLPFGAAWDRHREPGQPGRHDRCSREHLHDRTAVAGTFYYYAVTALNRLHHESAAADQVSNDTEAPVVKTQDIARSLLGGTLSITAAEVDNGSTDNWGIASLSLNKTEFSCSDIGDKQVILSATDKAGNVASASATVKVLGVIPVPSVTVSGVSANTITLGYGRQEATFSATDSAPASVSNFVGRQAMADRHQ